MLAWQEKQERAQALIEEIKVAMPNVEKAEDALKLRKRLDDARKLAGEAGKEHADYEKAQLSELMAGFESEQAAGREKISAPLSQPFTVPTAQNATLNERMRPKVRMLATQRFIDAVPDLQKAALAEGVAGTGGYLVVPQYMQELFAETRRQGNALRSYGFLNIHPVESNLIYIPRGAGAASVAIVNENAAKPSTDQSYTQVTVNIYTFAGISKQSKQMVMDSSPTVLDLSTRELGTLLGNKEEQEAYAGTGTNEPLGILNTTGLAIAPQTASDTVNGAVGTSATAQNIIDQMLNAVVAVATNYYAPPSGAMMHPRRLGFLLKGKDTATNYLFNFAGTFRAPNFNPVMDSVTSMSTGINTPPVSLLGLPLGTSTNIPTNANYGTSGASDQDVIIVGAWQEAHWFQRQDVTLDTSDTAGTSWETNQVWVRCEERAGFTAARYPNAFAVVHGKGLAGANS